MTTKLIKSTFSIESSICFNGYHDPISHWNGWKCPYFQWEDGKKIAGWLNDWTNETKLIVDESSQLFIMFEEGDEEPVEISGIEKNTEDGVMILYPIGTGYWIWDVE